MMNYLKHNRYRVLAVLFIIVVCSIIGIGAKEVSIEPEVLATSSISENYITEPYTTASITTSNASISKTSAEMSDSITNTSAESTSQNKVLKNTPILFKDIKFETAYNVEFYTGLLDDIKNSVAQLKSAIDSDNYSKEACELMSQEITRLRAVATKAIAAKSTIWHWEDEYYYAIKAWDFFDQRGYSNVVIGAILGNMMVETSGGTLQLNPTIYNSTGDYYGLCQWSLYYRPELDGITFEEQLEYLNKDMAKEFNTFGNLYYSGFTYKDFLAMEDPAEAALAFAKVYERCASYSYSKRQTAAKVAYDYFTF
jgi:hypothetical protein